MKEATPGSSAVRLRWDSRPGDLGSVLSLHGLVYAKELGFDTTFEGYVAETLAHFASPPDQARERLWLAEADERIVGAIAIIKRSEEQAQLRWFLVDAAFRGRGLGRRLLQEALSFARAAGYHAVFLVTLKELVEAAALYRSVGFKLIAEKQVRLGGREVTDHRYEMRFVPAETP